MSEYHLVELDALFVVCGVCGNVAQAEHHAVPSCGP